MKRMYKPYTIWEDYLNGMWRAVSQSDETIMLPKAIEFTSNHLLYGRAMTKVMNEWPNTMLNSLTNTNINRKAFLGHCAVQYELNIPEYITRQAWKYLTVEQRNLANKQAEINIKSFENAIENTGIYKKMGTKLLF